MILEKRRPHQQVGAFFVFLPKIYIKIERFLTPFFLIVVYQPNKIFINLVFVLILFRYLPYQNNEQ